jgi:DNA replication protein DnaC
MPDLTTDDGFLGLPWVREGLASRSGVPDCALCGPRPLEVLMVLQGREMKMRKLCEHQEAELAQRAAAMQARSALAEWQARHGRYAVPADFAGRTLDDVDPSCAGSQRGLAYARYYLDHWDTLRAEGAGMVFHGLAESAHGNPGGMGCGKTLVATAIAAMLEARGESVAYVKCRDLADAMRDFASGAREAVLAAMRGASLLVLDEMVNEHETAYTAQAIIATLDHRYEAARPTLVTTNFERRAIGRHYERVLTKGSDGHTPAIAKVMAGRMMSRLTPPRAMWIPFDGPDQRLARRRSWGPDHG